MRQPPAIRGMEPHLLYFVSGVGDALCDALVCADGGCQFCVVPYNEFIQVTVTPLIGFFETPLLVFSVFNIITGRQGPDHRDEQPRGVFAFADCASVFPTSSFCRHLGARGRAGGLEGTKCKLCN